MQRAKEHKPEAANEIEAEKQFNLAKEYFSKDEKEKAFAYYKKATECAHPKPDHLKALAWCYKEGQGTKKKSAASLQII